MTDTTKRKELLDRLSKLGQDKLEPSSTYRGLRIRLKDLTLHCEIAAEPGKANEKKVKLFLHPAPCGPNCSDDSSCGCCFSWFGNLSEYEDGNRLERPLALTVKEKSKLSLGDNEQHMSELLEELQRVHSNGHANQSEGDN